MNVNAGAPLPLLVERDGAIVRLTFNRPQALNALDLAMAQAFVDACQALSEDAGVRAVVLRGAGRAFMAGGDLAAMHADPVAVADALISRLHAGLKLLARIDAPLLAVAHGVVAGAGLSVMMAADLVIAADGTRFNLAYVNVGASCDGSASWSLPRVVGLRRALEIALLGDDFDAQRAHELGIVNRVVPGATLDTEAEALAQRLAAGPTRAIGHMRRLMRESFDRDLAGQLDAERSAFLDNAAGADFAEGVGAFLAKRKPRFSGR